ncbi:hypothetical protein AYI69_g4189 [Smittium culicis]|uniref:Uncharacterized protein n=1 Tax=Smittium culicis TaxID=133412 RepID=A0A1R1YFS0_9FUNG|nr:hypothetical protein AYI69_g4189 [Smittium culicis]
MRSHVYKHRNNENSCNTNGINLENSELQVNRFRNEFELSKCDISARKSDENKVTTQYEHMKGGEFGLRNGGVGTSRSANSKYHVHERERSRASTGAGDVFSRSRNLAEITERNDPFVVFPSYKEQSRQEVPRNTGSFFDIEQYMEAGNTFMDLETSDDLFKKNFFKPELKAHNGRFDIDHMGSISRGSLATIQMVFEPDSRKK